MIVPIKGNSRQKRENTSECVHEAVYEAFGRKRKVRSRKGLRTWNAEIETTIRQKQYAYKVSLQTNTEVAKSIYKRGKGIMLKS